MIRIASSSFMSRRSWHDNKPRRRPASRAWASSTSCRLVPRLSALTETTPRLARKSLSSVGNICCEVMEIHQTDSPRKTVVIVPGNPGICDYYKEYMEFLADRVPSDWNLICHGFLGHGEMDYHAGKLFTLQDQLQHHLAFLNDIPGQVVLVGHSIGSHCTIEAKKAMPEKVR
mmetsp:Transcript_38917/g.110149  ORF Transcript_38917/g.110149 Transcript_38917/m.110149 type:complete len:173 (-) Transcript_38917:3074-3592(-)